MRDREAGKSTNNREGESKKKEATTCSAHLLQEKRDKFKRTTDKRQERSMKKKRNATKERESKCLRESESKHNVHVSVR